MSEFQDLYQNDPFYEWFGLANPLMYAAHKAAGGMTSVYRQIGIGCERLFRAILRDCLDLSAEDVKWSYEIPTAGGRDGLRQSLPALRGDTFHADRLGYSPAIQRAEMGYTDRDDRDDRDGGSSAVNL